MKIDGKLIANKVLEELKTKAEKQKGKNIIPHLAIILIGNDPASISYIEQKDLKAEQIGAKTTIKHLSSDTSQPKLLKTIQQFNNNNNVHGIIVQRPLPSLIDSQMIKFAIDPKKDVDGFHPQTNFQPPILSAVLKILEKAYASTFGIELRSADWLKSKKIVVAGKGETGGQPIINGFKKMGIKAVIIDSKTLDPSAITKSADIIISAVGKPKIIKSSMIKKGVILVSIGLHKGLNGKLHGDYEEKEIENIASFYTPTPGGVGPVNVAMLYKNLLKASR